MTSTKTVSVDAEELRTTFEFVSFGAPLEHSAYICIDTGKIYCHSLSAGLEEEEDLPEDLETSDHYIAVPHKNDLGLGRNLALASSIKNSPTNTIPLQVFSGSEGRTAVSKRCCMHAVCWTDGMNSKTVRWKRLCSLGAKRTALSLLINRSIVASSPLARANA
jgi:hypothetical protein